MMEDIISKLTVNPLFQLSLASRELFHSNFLYWLSVYDESKFKELIDLMTGNKVEWSEKWSVYREDNKFDLCIRRCDGDKDKEYLLVLENKVKSIVEKQQLDKYYQEATKKNCSFNKENPRKCSFFLLTLATQFLQDSEIAMDKQWGKVSYEDYAKVIRTVYLQQDESNDDINKGIIRQYHSYIDFLSQKKHFELPDEKSCWKDLKVKDHLKKLRIDDLRQKMIANQLATWLIKKLKGNDVVLNLNDKELWNERTNNNRFYILAGYANGRALLHISRFASEEVIVRIEIEGDKYKRAVIIKKKTSEKNTDDTAWKSIVPKKTMGLFADNSQSEAEPEIRYHDALKKKSSMKKDYGTYDMKNLMKYQYRVINPDSKIMDVLDAMIEDLRNSI